MNESPFDMDSQQNRGVPEPESIDLSQVKCKYSVKSKPTLVNVLTEYGLPQEDQKKKKVGYFDMLG